MAYRVCMLTSAFLVVSSVFLGVKYRQGLKKLRLFAELLIDLNRATLVWRMKRLIKAGI